MSFIYGKSYPPQKIEDHRSQFEQERDNLWNHVQIMRQMFSSGNPQVTLGHLERLEVVFKEKYGVTVDDYDFKVAGK